MQDNYVFCSSNYFLLFETSLLDFIKDFSLSTLINMQSVSSNLFLFKYKRLKFHKNLKKK